MEDRRWRDGSVGLAVAVVAAVALWVAGLTWLVWLPFVIVAVEGSTSRGCWPRLRRGERA